MTFHLAGWSQSVDQPTVAPISALADPVLTVSGNNIQVPDWANYLVGAAGVGVNLTRFQIQSPSLRRILNYEVAPLNYQATPLNPAVQADLFDHPIQLDPYEQLQAYCAEDGAGATRMNGLIWLGDGKLDQVTGPVFSMRATASVTLTAYAWTNTAITFDQVLPVGNYAIVGARFFSTGLIAFRFVLQGQTARPGALGQIDNLKAILSNQREGGWGNWGVFNSTSQPTMDFLSSSADTSETGVIDLVPLGS